MKPVRPEVLRGRNPWWREAWDELAPSDRRAIQEAMRQGMRVPEDRLLPFVYGYMAIERRSLRWVWLQVVWVEAIAGFGSTSIAFDRPTFIHSVGSMSPLWS